MIWASMHLQNTKAKILLSLDNRLKTGSRLDVRKPRAVFNLLTTKCDLQRENRERLQILTKVNVIELITAKRQRRFIVIQPITVNQNRPFPYLLGRSTRQRAQAPEFENCASNFQGLRGINIKTIRDREGKLLFSFPQRSFIGFVPGAKTY